MIIKSVVSSQVTLVKPPGLDDNQPPNWGHTTLLQNLPLLKIKLNIECLLNVLKCKDVDMLGKKAILLEFLNQSNFLECGILLLKNNQILIGKKKKTVEEVGHFKARSESWVNEKVVKVFCTYIQTIAIFISPHTVRLS